MDEFESIDVKLPHIPFIRRTFEDNRRFLILNIQVIVDNKEVFQGIFDLPRNTTLGQAKDFIVKSFLYWIPLINEDPDRIDTTRSSIYFNDLTTGAKMNLTDLDKKDSLDRRILSRRPGAGAQSFTLRSKYFTNMSLLSKKIGENFPDVNPEQQCGSCGNMETSGECPCGAVRFCDQSCLDDYNDDGKLVCCGNEEYQ